MPPISRIYKGSELVYQAPGAEEQVAFLTNLVVGDRIQLFRAANVRSEPVIATNTLRGVNSTGARGTVRSGPRTGVSNSTWYDINFDLGYDGWVVSDNYNKVTGTAAALLTTPGTFRVGDRVRLTRRSNVRSDTVISTTTLRGINPQNAEGVITQGPRLVSNINWYYIDFSSGFDGWVASDNYTTVASSGGGGTASQGSGTYATSVSAPPTRLGSDPTRFAIGGNVWYAAGYYPALGGITSGGSGSTYYQSMMNTLSARGINFVRIVFTMGQQTGSATIPYQRTGAGTAADGRPRYNLSQFNQAHFNYFKSVVSHARSRNIVVQLCIFDCWHNRLNIVGANANKQLEWGMKYDFYNGANNVNSVNATTFTQWIQRSGAVYNAQVALVNKVVDELGSYPNIIWEVANEATIGGGSAANAWQNQIAGVISSRESTRGFARHLVMPRDLPNHEMIGHDLINVTQVRNRMISERSRNQPLISDNDVSTNTHTPTYRRQKAWACLTAGAHINFFHFPMEQLSVLNSSDATQGMTYVAYTKKFLTDRRVNLVGMRPSDSLVSNGWCLARSGNEYVIYLINGGSTTVSSLPSARSASWFNPRTGASQTASGGPTYMAPDGNDWVLHIVAS